MTKLCFELGGGGGVGFGSACLREGGREKERERERERINRKGLEGAVLIIIVSWVCEG